MKTSRISSALALAATAMMTLIFNSCGFDGRENPGAETIPYESLVTLAAQTPTGQNFTYRTGPDTELITLQATKRIDTTEVRIGQRLIIRYDLPAGTLYGSSGPIDLKGYRKVINATLKEGAIPQIWNSWQLRGISANRTGHWLNLIIRVSKTDIPTQFEVMANPQSIANGSCDIFLITNIKEDLDRPVGYLSDLVASVNIEWFMTKYPQVHTINLHLPYDGDTVVPIGLK